ncbi:hypothetical protein [Bdellovibrio sp. HCB337]|uniref:hypothetical protein n=1 Tax=Bdellovibrio sp. HCB337 TaxID=3394358 RepID=UPI0039A6608B
MKALRYLFLTLMTLSLAACAFDKNSNTDVQRELEDNAALEAKFARVTGKYVGTINTGAEPQQVELSFYPYYKKIGQNSNGEDKYKPELRARYRLLNTVVQDVILSVGYYEQVNKLVMTTLNENAPTVISINGEIMGTSITADVAKNNVPFGTLNAELASRQYSAPSPNDGAEYNDRLRKLYDTIKGTYAGKVTPSPREGAPFEISVRLTYVDRQSPGSAALAPVLEAYYRRVDDRDRSKEAKLVVTYIPETNQISMDAGGTGEVSIVGDIRQNVIRGTYSGFRGLEGGVYLKKTR